MKIINDFATFKKSIKLQQNTIDEYVNSINKFVEYIKVNNDKQRLNNQSFSKITSEDIQNYAILLRESYSINSVKKELAGIKQFFRYLARKNLIDSNPVTGIEMPKDDFIEEKKFMKIEEGDILFDLADNARDKLIIGLGCYNGLRREEVVELNISDINIENNTMTFMRKNQKMHTLTISKKILPLIKRQIESNYPNEGKLIGVGIRRVNQIFDALCNEAGLVGKQYHFHALRAVCASSLYANGFREIQIQKFLNHTSLTTTLLYLDVSMDDFMKKYEDMDI